VSCRELAALLTDYLEETMPAGERRRLDAHLAACRDCHAYLDSLRLTLRELGSLGGEELASAAPPELLERFRDWARER
jgi:anti-sigma factor RsiW